MAEKKSGPRALRYSGFTKDVERVAKLEHGDPHNVLGIHQAKEGVVVRCYRPEAEGVKVLRQQGPPLAMEKIHKAGIFEGVFAGETETFAYQLQVDYGGGAVFTIRDPYAFLPTLGDLDLHLASEGKHERLHEKLGAHVHVYGEVHGVSFAVWAPMARGVSVVGAFNHWDGRLHAMRHLGKSGIWELFIPEIDEGSAYGYEIAPIKGERFFKMDPYAFATKAPPAMISIVHAPKHQWQDAEWMAHRTDIKPLAAPMAVYECHLGSWRRVPEENNRSLNYRELANTLPEYLQEMGFTHVELLPPAEHPFGGSWGYQVSAYFAPTARFGKPDDLRYLIDRLHQKGIGVIIDWVPAHFPRDKEALARFDGTALYEHEDPRQGAHPDWGTLVYNYCRPEVRNFLIDNALFWLEQYHVDGLRVDAVASMLYLDYSRKAGEWIPNKHGGRENLEAIEFLKELNEVVQARFPGVMTIAEESTAWPMVTKPGYLGGLGFTFKWNMGWMHDNLSYFAKDSIFRKFFHRLLTFGMLYAYSEKFVLPLSHDEVVHLKKSLLLKMPGDEWKMFANLRCLYAYMWAFPGKKLLFMGGEFGQRHEWNHDSSLEWHLLEDPYHQGVHQLMRDLNRIYGSEKPMWEADYDPAGFKWIDVNNADENVVAFARWDAGEKRCIVVAANFSPIPRPGYRIGLPNRGVYKEILNTDSEFYGGSNVGNGGEILAQPISLHGFDWSAELTLPPLAVVYFKPEAEPEAEPESRGELSKESTEPSAPEEP
ncbi:MAG: 1,4-alpha-glucan branching protein GlgB [Candidatus Wallbacteria bacterium]|nr:1,4-alpha-glucan branching protein GlgB [Candidatus Wallbacteria bacterium]